MKIISFDIGIKNLAYCCFYVSSQNKFEIESWDVINLCEETNYKCCEQNKKKQPCTKEAKYHKNNFYYCKQHAKKSNFKIPSATAGLSALPKLKKLKVNELYIECSKLGINYVNQINYNNNISDSQVEPSPKPLKKNQIIELMETHFKNDYLEPVVKIKAEDMTLPVIAQNIMKEFDNLFSNYDFDHILIENQISPIANRMKTVQGMITQYFVMKGMPSIHYVSSSNKLKHFIEPKKKTTYAERKKLGVSKTKDLVDKLDCMQPWCETFDKHKKKDDLADSFLQGLWFLRENEHLTLAIGE